MRQPVWAQNNFLNFCCLPASLKGEINCELQGVIMKHNATFYTNPLNPSFTQMCLWVYIFQTGIYLSVYIGSYIIRLHPKLNWTS